MIPLKIENPEEYEEKPMRKYVSTKTLLVLILTGIFVGTFAVLPLAQGDTISYNNVSDALVIVKNLYGMKVGQIEGKWVFAVDQSTNQFYLSNQNTFFYVYHWSAFLWSSNINNVFSPATYTELYATYTWSVSSALSGVSGSTINEVTLNPGNIIQIYILQYGQEYYNLLPIPVSITFEVDI
jgi:hypothetical protein